MAREAKGAIVDEVEYVVDIEGNRDDKDPFYVRLLPMNGTQVQELERAAAEMTGGKINFTEQAQKQVKKAFSKHVTAVFNYSIPHTKTHEILRPGNGTGLYMAIMDHGDDNETKVIDDIMKALKDHSHLRAGLRETLSSQSAQAS